MDVRLAVIFAVSLLQSAAALDVDDRFAAKLFGKKLYNWALLEYERQLFTYPDSSAASSWHYGIGVCRKSLGQYEMAIGDFAGALSLDTAADSARLLAGDCALRLNRVDAARAYLSVCRIDYSKVLLGYSEFIERDYPGALKLLSGVPDGSYAGLKARSLEKVVMQTESFRKKHYATAAILSLVPGLGHLYAGRKGDAAMTAMTISTGALITGYYAYFKARPQTITAGTITGLFYAGGIYGALVSVKLYNTGTLRKRRMEAEKIVFEP